MREKLNKMQRRRKTFKNLRENRNSIGNFSFKVGQLKNMIWQAKKHISLPLIILSMMKAVLRHPLGPSAQHTSFILKILIGQAAKSRAKSAYFSCHTCVTLHIYYGKDIKKLSSLSNYGSFLYPCYPQRSTKNLMVTGGHLLWKNFTHS